MKPTVTIGIPAFNEEANISKLLADLAQQKAENYILEKIIVNSDGSTDNTVEIVNNFKNQAITVIDNKKNAGVAVRQNELLRMCKSSVFVLINADVRIKDSKFLDLLIKPIINSEAELTSPNLQEFAPHSFFESVLLTGKKLRRCLFESWRSGQNGYLCHGAVRAFSKKFYQKLHFTEGGGEDMYSYLQCINFKYKFRYVPDAVAYIRQPGSFRDHFKQSIRFFKYQRKMSHQFNKQIVATEMRIPLQAYVQGAIKAIPLVLRYPAQFLCYLLVVVYMLIRSLFFVGTDNLWNATSTKVHIV